MTFSAETPVRARTGVLLVNLGTPEAPTPSAIRRYLRDFLLDPRVVEAPRALWLPFLYAILLPLRPRKLVPAYQSIWTEQGSPLLVIGQQQRDALQAALGRDTPIALAMRYGEPSIESALQQFEQQNVRRLLVLPLYPQYSATTTASVFDAVFDALKQRRNPPELRTLHNYHDHPAYIQALANSISDHWQHHARGEHLLLSFHSIPQRYVDLGDPYQTQCQATARALIQTLGLSEAEVSTAYQSRVGRMPWLSPYTDEHIVELAQKGIETLDVICPGFSADCLETLEEIAQRYATLFIENGGKTLRYIPALNARADHIQALKTLVQQHTQGWESPE